MKKVSRYALLFASLLFIVGFVVSSCKSKDPSILKVYVRDENNDLLAKAKVIIIGDTKSNPPTVDYVDTIFTDSQGIAYFDMEEFYTLSGKSVNSGYFDILVKYLTKQATGRIRVKKNIVSVETVRFEP
jgi:hypothetical protein